MNLGVIFLNSVTVSASFIAGFLTFFTPCILPLIPAWLTLASGLTFDELASADRRRFGFLKLLMPTIFFVAGFTIVFSLMGAAAGLAGEFLADYGYILRYLTGAFLIFFGLYLVGIISPAFLMKEKRADIRHRPLGLIGSLLVGMGFAAGWTPCVGPVLASILAMAAHEKSAEAGFQLLAIFSLGLGVPFLGISLAWGAALSFMAKIRPVMKRANLVLGILMIILGLVVMAGKLNVSLAA